MENNPGLYELMDAYARQTGTAPDAESPTPNLGRSLSLLNACLIEAGLSRMDDGRPQTSALPDQIHPEHLSRFVVAFLPFNSVTGKEETNQTLFDVFSFLKWMEKKGVAHGWQSVDFQQAVRDLSNDQERCLKLSHLMDEFTGQVLDDPPPIVDTVHGFFTVVKKEGSYLFLNFEGKSEAFRLRLSDPILSLARLRDRLDLVLGDSSDRWILLEAGQVFPEYETSGNPPSD